MLHISHTDAVSVRISHTVERCGGRKEFIDSFETRAAQLTQKATDFATRGTEQSKAADRLRLINEPDVLSVGSFVYISFSRAFSEGGDNKYASILTHTAATSLPVSARRPPESRLALLKGFPERMLCITL